jgi:hypothetical protein
MGLFYSTLSLPPLLYDIIVLIASKCDDPTTRLNIWRTCRKLRDHPVMKEYARVAKFEVMYESIYRYYERPVTLYINERCVLKTRTMLFTTPLIISMSNYRIEFDKDKLCVFIHFNGVILQPRRVKRIKWITAWTDAIIFNY